MTEQHYIKLHKMQTYISYMYTEFSLFNKAKKKRVTDNEFNYLFNYSKYDMINDL